MTFFVPPPPISLANLNENVIFIINLSRIFYSKFIKDFLYRLIDLFRILYSKFIR